MDESLALALHALATSHPWLSDLTVALAENGILLIPVALVGVWLFARPGNRTREAVLAGCLAAVVAVALGLFLERILARPRPFVALDFGPLFPHQADSSFPSDHTLVGMALAGALLIRTPRIGVWLTGWVVLIGLARAAAGVHFVTDVLGSMLLGLVLDWAALQAVVRLLSSRWAVSRPIP